MNRFPPLPFVSVLLIVTLEIGFSRWASFQLRGQRCRDSPKNPNPTQLFIVELAIIDQECFLRLPSSFPIVNMERSRHSRPLIAVVSC